MAAFFRMSMGDQERQFRNYSLEEQYELFRFGNTVVHPPAMYLARPFAEEGPAVVPFLWAKLEKAADGAEVRDIALVLSEVSALDLYDFAEDPRILELLEQQAKALGGVWEPTTLRFISEIRNAERVRRPGQREHGAH